MGSYSNMKVVIVTTLLVSLASSAPHLNGYGHHLAGYQSSFGGQHGSSSYGYGHQGGYHSGHQGGYRYPGGYQAGPYGGILAASPGGGAQVSITGGGTGGGGVYIASNPGATHVTNLPGK